MQHNVAEFRNVLQGQLQSILDGQERMERMVGGFQDRRLPSTNAFAGLSRKSSQYDERVVGKDVEPSVGLRVR
jgi:hypothetical protein